MRLLAWGGHGSTPSEEAVLIPWAYREDCRPIAWTERLDWIPAGTRGAVTGWLRPREHLLDGLPTFAVEMAWREPVWTAEEPRWPGGADGGLMTPQEFLTFHLELPTFGDLDRTPQAAAERLRAWASAHPTLAAKPPAATMLSQVYRAGEPRSLAGEWEVEIRLLESRELKLRTASPRSGAPCG